jgi:hypothetical protein
MRRDAKMAAALCFFGLVFWMLAISGQNFSWIDPTYEFGLFQALPMWFWIGMLLEIAAILATPQGNEWLFVLQLLSLNLMIWGTPTFVEPNARINDTWQLLATASTILRSGTIAVTSQPTHFYLQYPSSFVLGAEIIQLSGLSPPLFVDIFPIIASSVFVIALYAWARNLAANANQARLIVLTFLLLDVWLSFHFSPQAFGLMLLPLVLVGLQKMQRKWNAIGISMFLSAVTFHPTSTLIFIAILGSQYAILVILRKPESKLGRTVILFAAAWIGWFTFSSTAFMQTTFSTGLRNLSLIWRYGFEAQAQATHAEVMLAPTIRLATQLFVFGIAALFLFQNRKKYRVLAWNLGWLIACVGVAVADLAAFGGTFGNRTLMFAPFVLSVMLVTFAWQDLTRRRTRRTLQVIALVVLTLNVSTLYYYESYNVISDSNLQTSRFLSEEYESSSQGKRLVGQVISPLYYYSPEIDWVIFSFPNGVPEELSRGTVAVCDAYTLTAKTVPISAYEMEELCHIGREKIGTNLIYSNDKLEVFSI